MNYFPEQHNKNKIEVEFDLSNYAIKSDLKKATDFDMSLSVHVNNKIKKIYLSEDKCSINFTRSGRRFQQFFIC